jgi:hypothetical protein
MQGFFSTEFLNPFRIDKALLASKHFFAKMNRAYFKTLSGILSLTILVCVFQNPFGKSAADPALFESA